MAGSHEMANASTKKVTIGYRASNGPPPGLAPVRSAPATMFGVHDSLEVTWVLIVFPSGR